MRNSIHTRLISSFGLCVFLMIAIVGLNYSALQKLEKLYKDAANRTVTIEAVKDAQFAGLDLHLILSNMMMDKEAREYEASWITAKEEIERKLQKVAAIAVTPLERARVQEAREALEDMIRLCEDYIFPVIAQGGSVAEVLAETDARVDRQTAAVAMAFQDIAESMSSQNQEGMRKFYSLLADVIHYGLILSVFGVVIAVSISTLTTRRIVRSLWELTHAAHQIENGNYQVEVKHQLDDEPGRLAKAFRNMAEQVQNRTLLLQESNERLAHEIAERTEAEANLQRAHNELDKLVRERTAELSTSNELLRHEISIHKQTEGALRTSEARLRDAQRMAHIGNWELDLKENRLWWSDELYQIFEMDPQEFQACYETFLELVHPDDRTEVNRLYMASVRDRVPYDVNHRILLSDGRTKFVHEHCETFYDEAAAPLRSIGTAQDITKLREAESEKLRLLSIIEATPDFVSIADPSGRVLYYNRGALRMLGLSEDQDLSDIRIPATHPSWALEIVEEALSITMERGMWSGETAFLSTDGRETPVSQIILSHRNPDGAIEYISTIARDISDLKRAEEALRESETHFRAVVEAFDGLIYISSHDDRIQFMNARFVDLIGRDATGEPCHEALFGLSSPCSWCVRSTVERGEAARWELQNPRDSRWYYAVNTPITHSDGTVSLQSMILDITERKEAENAIQTLVKGMVGYTGEEFYGKLLNSLCTWLGCDCAMIGERVDEKEIKVMAMHIDGEPDRDITFNIQGTPCGMTIDNGYTVYSSGVTHMFPQSDCLKQLGAAGYVGIPMKNQQKDVIGVLCAFSRKELELPRTAEAVLSIAAARASAEVERSRMEREKSKMERRLHHSQKMEAIGTLAGGIAHDFNNILTIIYGYAQLAETVMTDEPIRKHVQAIVGACGRAKDLVRQILTFSRMEGDEEPTPMDIRPIIKEALKFLRASLPTTIEIRHDITARTGMILAHPTQIHQVLTNLCTNAAHAMEDTGGLIEVALSEVDIDPLSAPLPPVLEPGPYLRLSVTDTGHGMDARTRERIFEPYFTTKETGKGTGLGLAVVHAIVERHKGAVNVYSEPGKGSTFHVYLPKTHGSSQRPAEPNDPIPHGTERILWIDDEEAVVTLCRMTLERLGYEVTTRTSSEEALEFFRTHPEDFDLIITDYTMPRMTGLDLAREITRLRPDIPIVLCTGINEKIIKENLSGTGIRASIMKPLTLSDIAVLVRKVLDEAKRPEHKRMGSER